MSTNILGVIDEDPFDSRTWSGSSKYFFGALDAADHLYRAIPATPSPAIQTLYKALSFHPDMETWKLRYHLNTGYFRQMTKVALKEIINADNNAFNVILQVGAWYNFSMITNKLHASYHDGNLATRLASPYGHPNIGDSYKKKAFAYEKDLYHGLDLIFPMSKWLADSFVNDFGVNRNKVHPVGAGINLPRISNTSNRDPDKQVILFVGKDFRRKGGHTLLDAFSQARKIFRHAELIIAGPQLENLPDGVTCVGYIDKRTDSGLDKLLDLYASASIFVLPSLYEPFGIAFAEAMAHRLPCIGTTNCAMPEIIDNEENGFLVDAEDSQALAEKIMALLSDVTLRKKMGDAAFNKYNNNYRWDIVASRITGVLENNTG